MVTRENAKQGVADILHTQMEAVRKATTPEEKASATVDALRWSIQTLDAFLDRVYDEFEYELMKQHAIDTEDTPQAA